MSYFFFFFLIFFFSIHKYNLISQLWSLCRSIDWATEKDSMRARACIISMCCKWILSGGQRAPGELCLAMLMCLHADFPLLLANLMIAFKCLNGERAMQRPASAFGWASRIVSRARDGEERRRCRGGSCPSIIGSKSQCSSPGSAHSTRLPIA